MSGLYLRGAFVEFAPTFLGTTPNIIVFQFNPESIVHEWKIDRESGGAESGKARPDPLAVNGRPAESFSFTIAMDANEMLADGSPIAQGIAVTTGIHTRLAALEMLMQPVPAPAATDGLVGAVSAAAGAAAGAVGGAVASAAGVIGGAVAGAIAGAAGGKKATVPAQQVPAALFVWGPGRILPVRVSNLKITENLFDGLLNPSHAEAIVELDVLSPDDVQRLTGPLRRVAVLASKYAEGLRQANAIANLGNSAESVIGMLPL